MIVLCRFVQKLRCLHVKFVTEVCLCSYREKLEEVQKIRGELLSKGAVLPPEKEKGEHFDSNCITPVCTETSQLSSSLLLTFIIIIINCACKFCLLKK